MQRSWMKISLIFGAVFTALLLISSVTAVPSVSSKPIMKKLEKTKAVLNERQAIFSEYNSNSLVSKITAFIKSESFKPYFEKVKQLIDGDTFKEFIKKMGNLGECKIFSNKNIKNGGFENIFSSYKTLIEKKSRDDTSELVRDINLLGSTTDVFDIIMLIIIWSILLLIFLIGFMFGVITWIPAILLIPIVVFIDVFTSGSLFIEALYVAFLSFIFLGLLWPISAPFILLYLIINL